MNISIKDSYEELSKDAAGIIVDALREKNNMLLCAATGSSPTLTYKFLTDEYRGNPSLFSRMRVIKLDEWGGVPEDNQGTCESYLDKNVLTQLQIGEDRYHGFSSNPEDPQKECDRMMQIMKEEGPVDLCILGIGLNGHLGFNEPAEFMQPYSHIAELSKQTLGHKMAKSMEFKPGSYGLTLGMADILQSKKILMLINGEHKKEITREFLAGKVTPKIPASFLWLHPNVYCLIEKNAFPE